MIVTQFFLAPQVGSSSRRVTVVDVEPEASDYGYSIEVEEGYDEAVSRTRFALRAEGFSILTEMNVGGLLGPDVGEERQYLIMGAWAAPGSTRAVDEDLEVAVHMPCNFVIQDSGGAALVAALDPTDAADLTPAVRDDARAALARVFARIEETV
jgi:uncharacterized protein (DUF302 family)